MTNALISKRERLNNAAQKLTAFYFDHRKEPIATLVLQKHDEILEMLDAWYHQQVPR